MKVVLTGVLAVLTAARGVAGATLHVWPASPSPAPPFDAWSNAAHDIATAGAAAVDGDEILVTNGVYLLDVEILITNGITVRSATGCSNTVLDAQYPSRTIRAISLTHSNAVLDGFSIRNGRTTGTGGGLYLANGALAENCWVYSNRAEGVTSSGGGVYATSGSVVRACDIWGNTCRGTGPVTVSGGGAAVVVATLEDCRVHENRVTNTMATARVAGGGAVAGARGRIEGCAVFSNRAVPGRGGGVECIGGSVITNSQVFLNESMYAGGGTLGAVQPTEPVLAIDCVFSNNSATAICGGLSVYGTSRVERCTIVSNSAATQAGGLDLYDQSVAAECTVAYNTVLSSTSSLVRGGGVAAFSNCRVEDCVVTGNRLAGGTNAYGGGVYLSNSTMRAGQSVANTVTGVWEYGGGVYAQGSSRVEGVTVSNNVSAGDGGGVMLNYGGVLTGCGIFSNAASGNGGGLYVETIGSVTSNRFGRNWTKFTGGGVYLRWGGTVEDCAISDNRAEAEGGGLFLFNGGIARRIAFERNSAQQRGGGALARHAGRLEKCLFHTNSTPGEGGGFYATSYGETAECDFVGNTARDGGGAFLTAGATVSSAILASNGADRGGGVFVVDGGWVLESALNANTARLGGGVCVEATGTVRNCSFSTNVADYGGGLFLTGRAWRVENCTSVSNRAQVAGGGFASIDGGTTLNTILWMNSSPAGSNVALWGSGAVFDSCDSGPRLSGTGNLAVDPVFLNAAKGNWRLRAGSPCIDTGTNLTASVTNDLDGLARPIDGDAVPGACHDMGAYEFDPALYDSDGDGMPDAWEGLYGFNPLSPADGPAHADADGASNRDEFLGGTDPTNALSVFRIDGVDPAGVFGWPSATGHVYTVETTPSLDTPAWVTAATNLPAAPPRNTWPGALPESAAPVFYRVGADLIRPLFGP